MDRGPGAEAGVAPRSGLVRERWRLGIVGLVQGVGFRPFVYRLAVSMGVAGWVENDGEGVTIEVEGEPGGLARFAAALETDAPSAARILELRTTAVPVTGEEGFRIRASRAGGRARAWILPDLATCPACRTEILDPADRRFRYPFTNCTHCGPRFTILDDLPYDRARTSMHGFVQCGACAREYADPANRRFHAQPNACPDCGPQLSWREAGAAAPGPVTHRGDAALRAAVAALRAGRIVAMKGLGGYHLLVDAGNETAVAELRRRKRRAAKPFAVMMPDPATLERCVHAGPLARELLESPAAPIVLLPRRIGSGITESVAPGSPVLGVFLPYTPLHHLVLSDLGRPVVATSGNHTEEPTLHREEDAALALAGIADGWLDHDRPIRRVADDSVLQILERPRVRPQFLRRARGYAPLPVLVDRELPDVLALGGQMNAAFALSRGREIVLSPHLGDLDGWEARSSYERMLDDMLRLYERHPTVVVHDLHPDYFTTRLAETLAARWGVPRVAVQHHHAHLAACLLENGIEGPALGIVWDGTGYGDDRTVWGGEFLLGDAARCERVATLHPFRLPGGERAVRETWRIGLALVAEAFAGEIPRDLPLLHDRARGEVDLLVRMSRGGVASPLTTSMGRLFDGVAALLGLCFASEHQAHAPQLVEAAAWRHGAEAPPLPLPVRDGRPLRLDWRPLVRALVEGVAAGRPAEELAASFHASLVTAAADVVRRMGAPVVALAGGVFANRYLSEGLLTRLEATGVRVATHERLPPTDGSLAAGQLWVATYRSRTSRRASRTPGASSRTR